MKQLILIFMVAFISQYTLADSAQILRAKLNTEHFGSKYFQGGVIELENDIITLTVHLTNTLIENDNKDNSNEKQLDFRFNIISAETDECGTIIYRAEGVNSPNENKATLYDHSNADACDIIHLYPVKLEYTTVDIDKNHTSSFDASKFQSENNNSVKLNISNTEKSEKDGDIVILPVIDLM